MECWKKRNVFMLHTVGFLVSCVNTFVWKRGRGKHLIRRPHPQISYENFVLILCFGMFVVLLQY